MRNYDDPVIEEDDFICIGILAMRDVLREGVKEAVRKCHTAGIKVFMMTGINPITAGVIAQECGIISQEF